MVVGRQQGELAGDLFGLRGVIRNTQLWAYYILERLLDTHLEMPSSIGYIVWEIRREIQAVHINLGVISL